LEALVALETLDVTNICTEDLSILLQCPRVVTLSAKGGVTALESIIHAAAPSLVDCRLRIDRRLGALKAGVRTQLDASTLRRCRSLREVDLSESDVTEAVLTALADVTTLETLSLSFCHEVHDVSALARSVSLRQLDLNRSAVCDAGIAGLERIPSLTWFSLASCESITNVTNLFRSESLRILVVLGSSVTDAGLAGLESAPALEFVRLRRCAGVTDAASVALRAAERSVKVI
jgi:hypothetical protein